MLKEDHEKGEKERQRYEKKRKKNVGSSLRRHADHGMRGECLGR